MKITEEKKEEILNKTKILESTSAQLKTEFIGINDIIDQLINSIKPYYFFSEYLKKPLVINVWGLTGTGKTSIINRLCDLLNLRNKLFSFDSGEYVGAEYKLKYEIIDKLSKQNDKNIILLFDEFQLCRTINSDGKEIDRIGLRPLWELIDSGVAYAYKESFSDISSIFKTLFKISSTDVQIENGIVTGGLTTYRAMVEKKDACPCDYESYKNITTVDQYYATNTTHKTFSGENPYFVKVSWIRRFVEKNPEYFIGITQTEKELFLGYTEDNNLENEIKLVSKFRAFFNNKNIAEIREIVKYHFLRDGEGMRKLDFSQSLIFCVGNLDEAYAMAHSVNPDSDADLFHNHSLKISVPQIKHALSLRFRMEQIGRLGNNHIIYPALSRDNYEQIIKLYLKQRIDLFKNEYSIDLKFTSQLEDIIYKESVFPTQGVRPVLSTMNNQIDSFISRIISDILIGSNSDTTIDINRIIWNYNKKKNNYEINVYSDDKLVFELFYPVILLVEKLRKSDKSEDQAYTAIHEAGHAIAAIYGAGLLPVEVVSKTAASEAKGFCRVDFPEVMTKDLLLKEIVILYGGIEAEKLIFGDEYISTGAGSDIRRATSLIANYFKSYGMDDAYLMISSTLDSDMGVKYLHTDTYEDKIVKLSIKLKEETSKLLTNHKTELLKLGDVLSKKSKITSKNIATILDLSNVEIKTKDNYYTFKDKIKKGLETPKILEFR